MKDGDGAKTLRLRWITTLPPFQPMEDPTGLIVSHGKMVMQRR